MSGAEVVDAVGDTRVRTTALSVTITRVEFIQRGELTKAARNGAVEEIIVEKKIT